MHKRDYQSSLIITKLNAWIQANKSESSDTNNRHFTLRIHHKKKEGGWEIKGNRLVWKDDFNNSMYVMCDSDDLWEERNNIGEISLLNFPRLRELLFMGNSFESFLEKISQTYLGRPALTPGEKSVVISFRLPESIASMLGDKRNERARDIVLDHLTK